MASADQLGFTFPTPGRHTWKVHDLVAAVRTHIERDVWTFYWARTQDAPAPAKAGQAA